jgi:Leucine-rich repeat (LRR) protein
MNRRSFHYLLTTTDYNPPKKRGMNISINEISVCSRHHTHNLIPKRSKTPKKLISRNQSTSMFLKVKQARTNGTINITNMHLTEIPFEVFDPNVNIPNVNWWEMVDITSLDASNNNLSENSFIDQQHNLSLLSYLNTLKFSNNNFTCIPDSLFGLSNLKILDMSCNKLSRLNGKQLKSLCSLVELDLSKNHLLNIPEEIKYLTYIEILKLSSNKLISLPNGIGSLYRMKKLYIDNNSISKLQPDIFASLPSLEELYMFNNRIETLNANNYSSLIDNLTNLKTLDAHCNLLSVLTLNADLPKLNSLLLSNNNLKEINGLDKCINLSHLDINNNKISYFPQEILKLQRLGTLNIQNNYINELPHTLGLMSNLFKLNIEGNPLKGLVTKMKGANTEQIKKYLKGKITGPELQLSSSKQNKFSNIMNNHYNHNIKNSGNINIASCIINGNLNMSNNQLKIFPINNILKYIRKNTLNKIDLSDNKLINIHSMENILPIIQSLKELNLSNNIIENFPLCILTLPNLSILNVSNNKLKTFPSEFPIDNIKTFTSNLTSLDLSFNNLTYIPEGIRMFPKLVNLIMLNNNITSINSLQKMKLNKIETINLGNNKIEKIPNQLYKNIPKLKMFIIENNNLTDIPSDFCLLSELNVINFYGNPIKKIRSDLLANAQNLITYLKRLYKPDNDDLKHKETKPIKKQIINKHVQLHSAISIQDKINQINQQIELVEYELKKQGLPLYKKNNLRIQLSILVNQRTRLLN